MSRADRREIRQGARLPRHREEAYEKVVTPYRHGDAGVVEVGVVA